MSEALHELATSLLLPLLRYCDAPPALDWGSDWSAGRTAPTSTDLLARIPRGKIPGLQQQLDACALAYVSRSAGLTAAESGKCGRGVATATRDLLFPLLRGREPHLNALGLLLTRRCVASDLLHALLSPHSPKTVLSAVSGWRRKCGRCCQSPTWPRASSGPVRGPASRFLSSSSPVTRRARARSTRPLTRRASPRPWTRARRRPWR